jgi:signal transduction histidine kinase
MLEPPVRAIERIDALTEDMLEFLRADVSESKRAEIPLEAIVRSAWKITSGTGADTTLEPDELDETTIYSVRERLQQIFENLFRNAIVHGGTPIEIEVGLLNDDDGFYVEDDGKGIAPEECKDVFIRAIIRKKWN